MRLSDLRGLSITHRPGGWGSPHEELVEQLLGAATLAVVLQEVVPCLFLVHRHVGFTLRRDEGGTRIQSHERYEQ